MTGLAASIGLAGVIFTAVVSATSCAVDARQLSSAGSGGFPAASGGDPSDVAAGQAGDRAEGLPLPVCDYADGVSDGCDTLVNNPGFARDTSGWSAEDATVLMSWSDQDASAHQRSGAVSVINSLFGQANGIASRAATQCLPTEPGRAYDFAVDVFIPEGQGSALDGGSYSASAGLSVIFYTSSRCDEYSLASASSALAEQAGAWAHLEGHAVAPGGAQSMLVRLATLKNFREYNFEARFDNVLVKAE